MVPIHENLKIDFSPLFISPFGEIVDIGWGFVVDNAFPMKCNRRIVLLKKFKNQEDAQARISIINEVLNTNFLKHQLTPSTLINEHKSS